MLNRTQSPPFNTISHINLIHPVQQQLNNGIGVYILNGGATDMIRIEVIVNNVNYDPSNPLKTMAVSALLKNGTKSRSAKEIAAEIDHYGAFLDSEYAADHVTVTLYTLNKHLISVLPILHALLNESIFPEDELAIYKRNQQQRMQVNMQKNDFVARKAFAHALFGDTAYGADVKLESYDTLVRADVLNYYQSAFVAQNYTIIVAGNFGEKEFDLLNNTLGSIQPAATTPRINEFSFTQGAGQKILIEKPDSLQSAIRMGMLSINRTHADFPGLSILNCVFGGYFGSRLMANIREDKGYTYGIGSAISSLKHSGQFFIATEVGTSVCQPALEEIYKEIATLKNVPIPEEELELVRNYMLGSLLGSLENIFSHAGKFKNLLFSNLGYDYYDRYVHTIKHITAEELQLLANKYFKTEQFTELVVGKMS